MHSSTQSLSACPAQAGPAGYFYTQIRYGIHRVEFVFMLTNGNVLQGTHYLSVLWAEPISPAAT